MTVGLSATVVSAKFISYRTRGGKDGQKDLVISLYLRDDLDNLVVDASVSIDVFRDSGFVASGTGTSGTDGTMSYRLKNAAPGDYETVVTDVTASGLEWDGLTPEHEPFTKE
jgi:hypothetical protein